jgi:hypothetical protein
MPICPTCKRWIKKDCPACDFNVARMSFSIDMDLKKRIEKLEKRVENIDYLNS